MIEPPNPQALEAFFGIALRWRLDRPQQARLLGVDQAELEQLGSGSGPVPLSEETLERLHHLLRIDAALHILLPIPERADSWVHVPNAALLFAGASALSHMLRGGLSDLRDVADHLASFLGGDFS